MTAAIPKEESLQKDDEPSREVDKESSAVEGLLGLSEADDGRRKSNRVRKKNHLLSDYEIGPIEGVEEPEDGSSESMPQTEEGKAAKVAKPPKAVSSNISHQVQNFLANLGLPGEFSLSSQFIWEENSY